MKRIPSIERQPSMAEPSRLRRRRQEDHTTTDNPRHPFGPPRPASQAALLEDLPAQSASMKKKINVTLLRWLVAARKVSRGAARSSRESTEKNPLLRCFDNLRQASSPLIKSAHRRLLNLSGFFLVCGSA